MSGYRGVKQAEGGSLSIKALFNAWKGDGEFKLSFSLCNQPLPLCGSLTGICQSAGSLASVDSSDELG